MSVGTEVGPLRARLEAGPDWIDVCAVDDIVPNCGAAALLAGKQIALVRLGEGHDIYALSNYDPFSEAFVIARGIVGDRDGRPKIASPIYKQSFDLRTGICLDDPSVTLPVYRVRVRDGRVQVDIGGDVSVAR
jgi:nitrite reductase (NADH) small subunit